ncbi:hypothetical protein ACG2F4_14440 [Halalkalibaculum sp. DA3122]|uniref:hypothetical protein n=1 Tax=Halalkalibaculum sp. DA3122 TaxID=3373607 RepID=UPI0037543A63
MSYKKKKSEVADLRNKSRTAQGELAELETKLEGLKEDFEASYESLTDARAKAEIGDASKKEVSKAEKKNQSHKSDIEATKQEIDTKKKVVSLLEEKLAESKQEFKQVAQKHHKKKIEPILENIASKMEEIESELDEIAEIRKDLQKDGFSYPDTFLNGLKPHSKPVITKGKIRGLSMKDFLTANSLTDNQN